MDIIAFKKYFPSIFSGEGLHIFEDLSAELNGFIPDVTTPSGRKEIASKAYKVSKAKVAFAKIGSDLKAEHQAVIKAVNAELNILTEKFDELRDRVRAPLDEFEKIEKTRVEGHQKSLELLKALSFWIVQCDLLGLAECENRLDEIYARDWQEFSYPAYEARENCVRLIVETKEKLEENARLRAAAEAEERKRIEAQRAAEEENARLRAEHAMQLALIAEQAERERLWQREDQEKIADLEEKITKKNDILETVSNELSALVLDAPVELAETKKIPTPNHILTGIKHIFMEYGVDEKTAVAIIRAIDKGSVTNLRIVV